MSLSQCELCGSALSDDGGATWPYCEDCDWCPDCPHEWDPQDKSYCPHMEARDCRVCGYGAGPSGICGFCDLAEATADFSTGGS